MTTTSTSKPSPKYINIRFIDSQKCLSKPFLIELDPECTLEDLHKKINTLPGSTPKDLRQFFYQEVCISGRYPLSAKIFSDIKELKNVSMGSSLIVGASTSDTTQPLSSLIFSQGPQTPTVKRGRVYFGRCNKSIHHTSNPEDLISLLNFEYKCLNCLSYHQQANLEKVDILLPPKQKCPSCNKVSQYETKIICSSPECRNTNLTPGDILWDISKDDFGKFCVNFSGCDHKIPINEFEDLLSGSIDEILKENKPNSVDQCDDFVFSCPRCIKTFPPKFSYAAFDISCLLQPRLKENVRTIVARKKQLATTQPHLSISATQMAIFEAECLEFIRVPLRCPTCREELDHSKFGETTHIRCQRRNCPQFCLCCLKTESEIGGNLFEHNVGFGLDLTKCPLFLECHPLLAFDKGFAMRDFIHWKIVAYIYDYAIFIRSIDRVRSITSLKHYTKYFEIWEEIMSFTDKCSIPKHNKTF